MSRRDPAGVPAREVLIFRVERRFGVSLGDPHPGHSAVVSPPTANVLKCSLGSVAPVPMNVR